jgi:hypothetical protein
MHTVILMSGGMRTKGYFCRCYEYVEAVQSSFTLFWN